VTISSEILGPILLSLRVSALSTLIVVPLAVGIAWVLARTANHGKSLLISLVNLPLVLPPVVTGYLLLDVLGRRGPLGGLGLAFTWWAAVAAAVVVSVPLAVWTTRVALEGVDPALENAARVLGRNEWQVFAEVTVPLARRGIAGGAVLAFARSLGEFGATIVVAGMTAGETLTIPSAVFLYMQDDSMGSAARALVWISAGISFAALLLVNATAWSAARR